MSKSLLIPTIVVAFAIVLPAMWLAVTSLLGRMSGWHGLARAFPDHPEPAIASYSWQSARMQGVNYGNCLRFDVCSTGLRVSVPRMLGPFQKPFFVPWTQVQPEQHSALFISYVRLGPGAREEGSLAVSRRTFDRIAANSPLRVS